VLPDTVCWALRKVHQPRYEAIRIGRERQAEPDFTEVDDRWREEFEDNVSGRALAPVGMSVGISTG
jgi:hypothetical protein